MSSLEPRADTSGFDALAATWDEKPYRAARAKAVAETIVQEVHPTLDMDVLDYGCGTGLLASFLLSHVRHVTGADCSCGMLDALRKKIEDGRLERMKAVQLDLEHDAIPSGRFHLIVINMVLHHVADVESLLRKFYQLLHPGGVLCVSDLDTEPDKFHARNDSESVHHLGFDRGKLKQQLVHLDFHDVRDATAHVIRKETEDGELCDFPVFLIWGKR